jgi:hypothetical protein
VRAAGGVRACVGSAVVVDFDRWGSGMGLAGQYEAGLELGCVKCKILLHRYCSCCDPGFASATRAAETGIRRVDVVVQRRFEDGLTRGEVSQAPIRVIVVGGWLSQLRRRDRLASMQGFAEFLPAV